MDAAGDRTGGRAGAEASGELAAYERRLRRAASDRAVGVVDPGLATILSRVRDHRAERSARRSADRPPVDRWGEDRPGEDRPASGSPGRVVSIEQVSSAVRIFRIGRPAGLRFRAGQYLKVGVSGRGRADFSIASAPHESLVELCIERIAGGRVTPALFGVGPGAVLEVSDRAKGRFGLDESASTHLFVATSTGIAPLRSMVRDALHRGLPGELIIVHGASHADELPYADELQALAASEDRMRYLPTVSRPTDARNRSWTGATGRVDPLAIEVASALEPTQTAVYVCGNSAMVRNVSTELRARGFRVATETFD
jgi:ferredoxin-NADP reductase